MNNQERGNRFESELKKLLNDNGLFTLNLGFNETADLIVLDGKARIIECKVTHKEIWYRKNPKQYRKLLSIIEKGKSVYIAIKFIRDKNRAFTIRFYYLKDAEYPFKINEGYSLAEFIEHCKKESN
jgi:Holliday junction resolvase